MAFNVITWCNDCGEYYYVQNGHICYNVKPLENHWNDNYVSQGYTCPNCGKWVGMWEYHMCPNWTYTWPAKQGWECPKCGTVHAPHVDRCNCTTSGASSSDITITWNEKKPPRKDLTDIFDDVKKI